VAEGKGKFTLIAAVKGPIVSVPGKIDALT